MDQTQHSTQSKHAPNAVVIVGGGSGIGLAAAKLFAEKGDAVTILGRSKEKLEAALKTLPSQVRAELVDGASEEAVVRYFAGLSELDHLVLSLGGIAARGPFLDLSEQQFRRAFDAKFFAYLRVLRHAGKKTRRSITLVTGAAALRAFAGLSGVAATNGALNAMVGPLSLELAPTRINAVAPGLTATPYWNGMAAADRQDMYDKSARRVPVGRIGEPEDIAHAIHYLATNPFTTGAVIPCEGGAVHC